MEKTYEISEVLKSLEQRFAMTFLGLLTRNEMPGIREKVEATHNQTPVYRTQSTQLNEPRYM